MNHVEVEFDEEVDKNSAERRNNYTIVEQSVASELRRGFSAGDTVDVGSSVLQPDRKTVTLTTWDSMQDAPYNMYVTGIKDVHGNGMTGIQTSGFTGSTSQDITPPELIARSPSSGETGVGLAQSVSVQFSEEMNYGSVFTAFYWTGGGGSVDFMLEHMGNNLYAFTPLHNLALNTQYTVGFAANTANDGSDNYLAASNWTFRTTSVTDLIRPRVESTSPEDGETNVSVNTNLFIEFSEPVDPASMQEEGVLLSPNPGDGIPTWTKGNSKLTFDPDNPLLANTTYNMLIPPGAVKDLAGNPLADGANIIFSTGPTLPTGLFSGTVAGDPGSPDAADPTGAIVVAFLVSIDEFDDSEDGPPHGGSGIVNDLGDYTVSNLEDDVYYPMGILDSNQDGVIDPSLGDAFGAYGIDFGQGDFLVDSVTILGGGFAENIDFPLFDPVAIAGTVSYGGTVYSGTLVNYLYFVGAFRVATFDTSQGLPEPDFSTYGNSIAQEPDYHLGELDDALEPDTWYVGAYLDVNFNWEFDPDIDPVGFYMAGQEYGAVVVENGHDELDIDIVMFDPGSAITFSAGSWRSNPNGRGETSEREMLSPAMLSALKKALDRSR
jgi:hypothetical protein